MCILVCFGTRPEFIKVASIINNFPQNTIKTCFTGQHKDIISLTDIPKPNYVLTIDHPKFRSTNRLNNIFCNILEQTEFLKNSDITKVLVQGDTTSAAAIALSAFHNHIPIIHLEAGLRTYDLTSPFPEEFNRQTISRIAQYHLCPTDTNATNLKNEYPLLHPSSTIAITGNTGLDNIPLTPKPTYESLILVTLHRSSNVPIIQEWFTQLNAIAKARPYLTFIIPLHPNPEIQKHKHLLTNITVLEPLSHQKLLTLLRICTFTITDSGGIQEEASFLHKRIIVCRTTTERPEILNTFSELCPTPNELPPLFAKFLASPKPPKEARCPYGDGNSWLKIKNVLFPPKSTKN